jgi:hypothetical protein
MLKKVKAHYLTTFSEKDTRPHTLKVGLGDQGKISLYETPMWKYKLIL